jgi:hypothetical protein
MSLFVLLALAIGFAVLCHKLVSDFLGASLLAALLSALALQVVGFIIVGYFDPFAAIAFVISFVFALFVALGFGWIMERAGTRRKSASGE